MSTDKASTRPRWARVDTTFVVWVIGTLLGFMLLTGPGGSISLNHQSSPASVEHIQ